MRVAGVDVVGLRRPIFKGVPQGTWRYWHWVAESTHALTSCRAVLVGDFNASLTEKALTPVTNAGWRLVTPLHGWSFRSKVGGTSTLDHALASPLIQRATAVYRQDLESPVAADSSAFSFAGSNTSYSDHAVMVLDIEN